MIEENLMKANNVCTKLKKKRQQLEYINNISSSQQHLFRFCCTDRQGMSAKVIFEDDELSQAVITAASSIIKVDLEREISELEKELETL